MTTPKKIAGMKSVRNRRVVRQTEVFKFLNLFRLIRMNVICDYGEVAKRGKFRKIGEVSRNEYRLAWS